MSAVDKKQFPLTEPQFELFSNEIIKKINLETFWKVVNSNDKDVLLFDSISKFLWPLDLKCHNYIESRNINSKNDEYNNLGIKNWQTPSSKELWTFVRRRNNPLRQGDNYRIFGYDFFAVINGRCDLDVLNNFKLINGGEGRAFPVNRSFLNLTSISLVSVLTKNKWTLKSLDNKKNICIPDLVKNFLENIDYDRCRLPKIENAQFTDPNKGIWEFYNNELTVAAEQQGIKTRNPALDVVNNSYVGIDFGTSSTVVSFRDGREEKLLRVGVQDFYKPIEQKHFENPTVLEFIDIPELLAAWQSEAYQPEVNWDFVHCSHEAQTRFRDNDGDTQVLASILTKMKQWALRTEEEDQQVSIVDFNNQCELVLGALTLRKPVKGLALEVSKNDPFDPIELYAWFLGLNINWRQRGLFLKYLMTFPVDYSKQVKEKILASFSRGLQRSLPKELISQEVFETFSVEERASEPAAYAASALPALGVEPTEEGVAYAVFDFGGGTADFDFGLYRLATEEEEDEDGYEQVFEHFAVSGDRFLGGENLLENMAYQTFQHNLDICRTNRIAFTCPLDAKPFSGSEMFIDRTQAAQTNTQMLIAKLRPLWEKGELDGSAVLKIGLLDRNGDKILCDFEIDEIALSEYLEERIQQGVHNFYRAMKRAFEGKNVDKIHVLLAGNSSQSDIVTWAFSLVDESIVSNVKVHNDSNLVNMNPVLLAMTGQKEMLDNEFNNGDEYFIALYEGEKAPEIKVHLPLTTNDDNPHAPTCKTGVALGLLALRPGSATKLINHIAESTDGEAPFAFHVGQIKRNKFTVGLKQSESYDTWHQIGPVRERMFELYATQSASAIDNNLPSNDPSLHCQMFEFVGNTEKHKVFAKAVGPKEIEICTALNIEALNNHESENHQQVMLK
ncbi:hypothetical protein [Photobacterium damselae]|uniref:hypothetical protein n=1 Tax=Photobacterium damselae TaxID=38293 RepID=UPI00370CF749